MTVALAVSLAVTVAESLADALALALAESVTLALAESLALALTSVSDALAEPESSSPWVSSSSPLSLITQAGRAMVVASAKAR